MILAVTEAQANQGMIEVGLVLLAILWVYLLPAIIAHVRHQRDRFAITVLNIFLGWTFYGWFIALIWALTGNIDAGRKMITRR